MKFKERLSAPRIIALAVLSLIPLAAIGLGIMLVVSGTLFNTALILGYIVLPLCALISLFLLLFSKLKIGVKIVSNLFLLILFAALFLFINFSGQFEMLHHYKNENVAEHYAEVTNDFEPMPGLSEIGSPESIDYYDYFSSQLGYFTCDADTLICQYREADYKAQKALLEEKYVFQNEPMTVYANTCEPMVEIDGYIFRVLSVNGEYGNEILYPKRLIFIATNDTTKEIVYMSFYDDDLDFIESLADFINRDCGWKHIK